jgi:phosphatidylserine synthase
VRYIADLLTFMRLLLAFAVPAYILQHDWLTALMLFAVAVLSDALDGWCARRWPYTPEQAARLPWRRIDAHALDNGPDTLMVVLASGALALTISYWWMLALVIYGAGVLFFAAVQLFIRRGKAKVAEAIDVLFGYWFVVNIGMVVLEMAYRAHVMMWTLGIGLAALAVLLPLKWERAVSRPETREAAMKRAK